MYVYEFLAIGLYFTLLLCVGLFSYKKQMSAADFLIGGRSLNYWLTALAAHASDMSNWLFTAYPALVLVGGMSGSWTACGLILGMFLNWQWIAPKIRLATERFSSLTFSSFFESRFADTSGIIRVFTACVLIFFYTVYLASALVGLGLFLETLFQLKYTLGIVIGIVIVIPYVFIGGYVTLAWIDLFQGLFLMGVIIGVPLYVLPQVGWFSGIMESAHAAGISLSFLPDFTDKTQVYALLTAVAWGLGYFGQPHIITKFMGIRRVEEMPKSKYIGMCWMVLSLGAATLVGLVGIAFFGGGLANHELVFVEMVRRVFHPFIVGIALCAVIAATINAMGSQVLVLVSSLAEDFYRKMFRKQASSKEVLFVSRVGIFVVAVIAFCIAYYKISTIYALVFYAWSGLGASFGPLLILSLYTNRVNKYGACAGVLAGGGTVAIWGGVEPLLGFQVPALIAGFVAGFVLIVLVSQITKGRGVQPLQ